jgi:hypothetical protein
MASMWTRVSAHVRDAAVGVDTDPDPLRLVGGALVVVGAATAGLPGVAVGTLAAVAVAVAPVPVPVAVAGGHVPLLAVGPLPAAGVALVEAGVALVVAAAFADRRTRALAAGTFVTLAAIGWWTASTAGVAAAAGALALVVAVAAYALHRYGLLRLGLLDAADAADAGSATTSEPEAVDP